MPCDGGFSAPRIRFLGQRDYPAVWRDMLAFTSARDATTRDELWLVEHPPVFTLGRAGRREHLIDPGDIPVVASDRGGQVTYHGPGQVVLYVLVDLTRLGLGVRRLVWSLEQAVVDVLAEAGLSAARRPGAPGVYVAGAKVAALGLRVRRGRTLHGLALNGAMDLAPFARIDPCGYPGQAVTCLADLGVHWPWMETAERLARAFSTRLAGEARDRLPAPV